MYETRTAVIIATRDRAEIAAELVTRLRDQTRPPDHIFVVGAEKSDVELIGDDQPNVTACVIPGGPAALRKQGVTLAGDSYDYLVFFDDSFLPSQVWIAEALAFMQRWPDVAGLSGIVLTGRRSHFGVEPPAAIVAMLDDAVRGRALFFPATCLDGVNMIVRTRALQEGGYDEIAASGCVFDDFDISAILVGSGRIGQLSALFGMSLVPRPEAKNGRLLGVLEIAYTADAKSNEDLRRAAACDQMSNAFVSSVVRALRPRRRIDARERLPGPFSALLHG